MTDDETVDFIRQQWSLPPRLATLTIPAGSLTELVAVSQHGRAMLVAIAFAIRSGLSDPVEFSDLLLAEADEMDRRLTRSVDNLWTR